VLGIRAKYILPDVSDVVENRISGENVENEEENSKEGIIDEVRQAKTQSEIIFINDDEASEDKDGPSPVTPK
jgi:hypothetical protein